jgi:hypothetical protein
MAGYRRDCICKPQHRWDNNDHTVDQLHMSPPTAREYRQRTSEQTYAGGRCASVAREVERHRTDSTWTIVSAVCLWLATQNLCADLCTGFSPPSLRAHLIIRRLGFQTNPLLRIHTTYRNPSSSLPESEVGIKVHDR